MAVEYYGDADSSSRIDTDLELINYLMSLYTTSRNSRKDRHDDWLRNYRLVHNKFRSSDSWIPAPKDSEIYPILSSMVGWLTDQENRLEYSPVCEPNSPLYSMLSQLGTDLESIMYSNWKVEKYDAQLKLILWDAFMYSIGIIKSVWDPTLASGHGNAVPRRIDPWSFYPDPMATSMIDMEYCVETHRLSMAEVCRRFPNKAMSLTASSLMDDPRPADHSSGGGINFTNPGKINGLATRWSNASGRGPAMNPAEAVTLYEFWIKESSPVSNSRADDDNDDEPDAKGKKNADPDSDDIDIVPQWRCIVICSDSILLNELGSDIHPFEGHPYDRYVFDDIGEFYGISLVDHLASPQLYINRLLTAVQHNTELTGNPVLVESKISGTTRRTITNKPGQRIPVDGVGGMNNAPQWLVPPSVSPLVMELIHFWISRMENISGLSAIVKGATPSSRNAEGVISTIQEAAFVRIRSAMHNYEDMIDEMGKKLTDMVINFYTEPRMMGVLGKDGARTTKFLAPFHFTTKPDGKSRVPFRYIMSVIGGSTFPTSRQARIAEADKLFALGAIDDQAILEAHQYNNIPEIIKRVTEKRAMGVLSEPGARQRAGRSS